MVPVSAYPIYAITAEYPNWPAAPNASHFNLRLLEGDPVAKLYYQRRWILIIELAPRSVEALPGQGWLTGVGPAPAARCLVQSQ